MVIHQKSTLQLCQLIFGIVLFLQPAVNALGGDHRHFPEAPTVDFLLDGHQTELQTGVVQLVQNVLHRHIAGQIPKLGGVLILFRQMAQHTVEQHVKIGPVAQHSSPEVALGQKAAVVIKGLPVGSQRQRHVFSRLEGQAAQHHIQIGQVQIQLVAGGQQNVLPDLLQILGLFRHVWPPFLCYKSKSLSKPEDVL